MACAEDNDITVACYYFGNYHPNDMRWAGLQDRHGWNIRLTSLLSLLRIPHRLAVALGVGACLPSLLSPARGESPPNIVLIFIDDLGWKDIGCYGNGAPFAPDKQGYDFTAVVDGPDLPGKFRVPGHPDLKPEPGQYRTDFEADLCIDLIRKVRAKPFTDSKFSDFMPMSPDSRQTKKFHPAGDRMPYSKRRLTGPIRPDSVGPRWSAGMVS